MIKNTNYGKQNKILIASNNIEERQLINIGLSEEDCLIKTANSFDEATKSLYHDLPDIIIASFGTNEFGHDLIKEIQNYSLTNNASVICITDHNEKDKAEALAWDIDDLITRPVSKAELLFRVSKILEKRKLVPEIQLNTPDSAEAISEWDNNNAIQKKKPVVLVVDDNKLIRVQLRDYVESLGYAVITAENGEEAFEVTRKHSLDLILLDIILPDLGGMELLEMLRQQKNLLQLPVIIISGLSGSESKLKALEIGADDYITKPVNYDELQAKMKTVLRKKFYFEEVTQNYHLAVKRAITDSLTELYNHGYFHEFLEREINRCRRYQHSLAVIIADIDYFKNYNDYYGHPKGDMVLKTVAGILTKSTRSTDHVARYGGEEFAVVLPETDLPGALIVAEKIRFSVEKHQFEGQETQPDGNLTISLGVSSITADDDATNLKQLIDRADQALYEAKKKGRNRVVSSKHNA